MTTENPTDRIDVLLLAAGLGTRLQPLTSEIPKALLPVCGLPMLDAQLVRLLSPQRPQVNRVIINLHHLADQVRRHVNAIAFPLESARRSALARGRAAATRYESWIEFSEEPEILGTGGAIAKAAARLQGDPVVVLNADAFFPAPVEEAVAFHRSRDFVATMVVMPSPYWPNVMIKGDLVADILPSPHRTEGYTFTGLHVVSRRLFDFLPARGFHDIRDTYRALIKSGSLGAFPWPGRRDTPPAAVPVFLDIGTPETYLDAHRLCAQQDNPLLEIQTTARRMGLARASSWDIRRFRPYLYGFIDPDARIGANVTITESVVFAGADIAPASSLRRCIIGPGVHVSGSVQNLLLTTKGRREIHG
ncbi:MAG: NDP-sugar synthase [Candidatus Eisenbacteria bacterium]